MTESEILELASLAHQKNIGARNQLIQQYYSMIMKVALSYRHPKFSSRMSRGETIITKEDLCNAGIVEVINHCFRIEYKCIKLLQHSIKRYAKNGMNLFVIEQSLLKIGIAYYQQYQRWKKTGIFDKISSYKDIAKLTNLTEEKSLTLWEAHLAFQGRQDINECDNNTNCHIIEDKDKEINLKNIDKYIDDYPTVRDAIYGESFRGIARNCGKNNKYWANKYKVEMNQLANRISA